MRIATGQSRVPNDLHRLVMRMNGVVNLDKPAGVSSARMVSRVKRLLPRGTKIGHAGTLDPFATGVLLLLIGKATKSCEALMNQPKQYEAVVKLGATTATDDPESAEVATPEPLVPTLNEIQEALKSFIGPISQRPPVFSAMKIGGRRAYDLARKGHSIEMTARTVQVYGIELIAYDWPLLTLRIECGRGTYIRSIARDLGEALGIGGYLTALQRTRVGSFDVKQSVSLEVLQQEGIERYVQSSPGL
jgi:tRNA pseudouridine55 synthase